MLCCTRTNTQVSMRACNHGYGASSTRVNLRVTYTVRTSLPTNSFVTLHYIHSFPDLILPLVTNMFGVPLPPPAPPPEKANIHTSRDSALIASIGVSSSRVYFGQVDSICRRIESCPYHSPDFGVGPPQALQLQLSKGGQRNCIYKVHTPWAKRMEILRVVTTEKKTRLSISLSQSRLQLVPLLTADESVVPCLERSNHLPHGTVRTPLHVGPADWIMTTEQNQSNEYVMSLRSHASNDGKQIRVR